MVFNTEKRTGTQNPAKEKLRLRLLYVAIILLVGISIALPILGRSRAQTLRIGLVRNSPPAQSHAKKKKLRNFDAQIAANANELLNDGRETFRFDTFGDEAFWGGMLQLHRAIEGASFGGVGPGISPNTALNLGLKVDLDALPTPLINDLRKGRVNLDDPATTLALLKLDAVVGVKGFFQGDSLSSVGITCAICHSTVDNSLTFGTGKIRRGTDSRRQGI